MSSDARNRAVFLMPSKDELWMEFIAEVATYGRIISDAHGAVIVEKDLNRQRLTLLVDPDAWFEYLVRPVARHLEAGGRVHEKLSSRAFAWDELAYVVGQGFPFARIVDGELIGQNREKG